MPTYEYACPKCEKRFEVFHGMSDESPRRCPKCKVKSRRVPAGGAGLLFKGSGFYITDYRSDNYKKGAKQEKGGDSGTGGKSGGDSGGAGKGDSSSGGKGGGKSPKD